MAPSEHALPHHFGWPRGKTRAEAIAMLKQFDQLAVHSEAPGVRHATVHALRHSFGAHLQMAGVSLADIADLRGHKDLAQ